MERLKSILESYSTFNDQLHVLDVATGSGAFLDTVAMSVPAGVKVSGVGIDLKPEAIEAARQRFHASGYTFEVMDSHCLTYDKPLFDIVCISNSLHHFNKPQKVLTEILRVLKPGGLLIVFEMVKDRQNEKQNTHVLMHHFWAEIDERCGVSHKQTFTRKELADLFSVYPNLRIHHQFEIEDEEPPTSAEDFDMLKNAVTSYQERTTEWSDADYFSKTAEALLQRIDTIGFESATECLWVYKTIK